MSDGYIPGETKVLGFQDLICAGVVQDGFGMDAGLVCEGAVPTVETSLIDVTEERI
jgi:hypothetical protein